MFCFACSEKALIRQNLTANSAQSVTATVNNRIARRAAMRTWLNTDASANRVTAEQIDLKTRQLIPLNTHICCTHNRYLYPIPDAKSAQLLHYIFVKFL